MVNGKAIGILRVYSSEERDFTPDECDFMLGVANISAIAIENARMHEATRLNYELLTSYNYQSLKTKGFHMQKVRSRHQRFRPYRQAGLPRSARQISG